MQGIGFHYLPSLCCLCVFKFNKIKQEIGSVLLVVVQSPPLLKGIPHLYGNSGLIRGKASLEGNNLVIHVFCNLSASELWPAN
jgi:hypothetical protein